MKTFTDTLKQLASMFLVGACVMLGIRSIEWLVPEPPSRIVVCMADDLGKGECQNLDELIRAKEKPAGAGES